MKIKDELAGTSGHCPKCKTEFVVPAPVETEGEPVAAQASSHGKEAAVATEESLEDEYQRILMGDGPPSGGSSRKAAPDSDAFLSVESSDEHPTSAAETHGRDERKSDPPPTKSKGKTTAEISASLMKNTAEPTMKKTGKAFGDPLNDKTAGRQRMASEARSYYAKQIGIGAAGFIIIAGGLYYLMSSMFNSTKLPPLARISGNVTLNEKPLPGAIVTFQPIIDGLKGSQNIGASVGTTDAKGNYEVFYVQNVRGAAVGKHYVQVRAQSEAGLELVPDRYNANSELQLEVKAGSNPAYNIPLKKELSVGP